VAKANRPWAFRNTLTEDKVPTGGEDHQKPGTTPRTPPW